MLYEGSYGQNSICCEIKDLWETTENADVGMFTLIDQKASRDHPVDAVIHVLNALQYKESLLLILIKT